LLLVVDEQGQVLLEKRPPSGIWGGLWSLPERPQATTTEQFCSDGLGIQPLQVDALPQLRHAFTHFELDIQPLRVQAGKATRIMEGALRWHAPDALPGLPRPIQRIIALQLKSKQE